MSDNNEALKVQSNSSVFRGVLVARSPIILANPDNTILLEVQTLQGDKIKIVAAGVDLPADVVPGNYYKFFNLKPKKLDCVESVIYQLNNLQQIEKEDVVPVENSVIVNHQHNYFSFQGKVTAVDKIFGVYELDSSKTVILSYLNYHSNIPSIEVGDEVDIKMAHRYCDSQGIKYYVLCFRSYINVRPANPSRKSEPEGCSMFLRFIEVYGLNLPCLLWLRENLEVVKACLSEKFLISRGASKVDIVYGDILMMMLSSNEEIKKKVLSSPHSRNVPKEFFVEPHNCLPMQEGSQLPSKPISIKDYLHSHLETDVSVNAEAWNYNICETQDNRPILAFVSMSKNSHRLCLTDGSGVEATIVFAQQRENLKRDVSSLHERIVCVKKASFVTEEYVENNEDDPGAEHLVSASHKFVYLMVNLDDITILEPDYRGFAGWTEIKVAVYLNPKPENDTGSELLVPLHVKYTQTVDFGRVFKPYVVLHKTPLGISNGENIHGYLMVRSIPCEPVSNEAKHVGDSSYLFLKIEKPHADFYDLIPSPGTIELALEVEETEILMKIINRRSNVPHTRSIRSKVKTTQCIPVPPQVAIYVAGSSWSITKDAYSVLEAATDPTFTSELVSICGTIVNRSHEIDKYPRETDWDGYSNDKNFGLPGKKSVIVLDLMDDSATNASNHGTTVRVYLSWLKSHQCPLGLLPGATVVLNLVYKAKSKSKTYFRSTALSSIEIVKLAQARSDANDLRSPTGPWVFPHELQEGASGWCNIDSPTLMKLEIETVCKQCSQSYRNGMCTHPGCCSPLGPRLKASARVVLENENDHVSLFINGQNVQVLLDASESDWDSLLVLADHSGGLLTYYKRSATHDTTHLENTDDITLYREVFAAFCESAIEFGRQYLCYCRRFKSSGHVNDNNFFCVALLPPNIKRSSEMLNRSLCAEKD